MLKVECLKRYLQEIGNNIIDKNKDIVKHIKKAIGGLEFDS